MKWSMVAIATVFCASVSAQQPMLDNNATSLDGWEWKLRAYADHIDDQRAAEEGVGTSFTTIELGADYIQQQWRTSLWLDIAMYDDERPFSQTVEGTGWTNRGDISSKSSDASGAIIGAAFGPQLYFGTDNANVAYVQAGLDAIVSSKREISSCSNCHSEDIDLDGGAVVIAGFEHIADQWRIGLNVRQHVSGDLTSGVGISVGYKF